VCCVLTVLIIRYIDDTQRDDLIQKKKKNKVITTKLRAGRPRNRGSVPAFVRDFFFLLRNIETSCGVRPLGTRLSLPKLKWPYMKMISSSNAQVTNAFSLCHTVGQLYLFI